MVLGVHWLLFLGSVLWDFVELRTKFTYKRKSTSLKGLTSASAELIDDKEICKISEL